jgi:PAS domain S-box-containing protein
MSAPNLTAGPADGPARREGAGGTQGNSTNGRTPVLWVTAFCTAFAVGLIFVASFAVYATYKKALSDAGEDLARLSLAIATHTHRIIFSTDLNLSNLEERIAAARIRTPDELERFAATPAMFDLLRDMVTVSSDIDALSIGNSRGQLINTSRAWPPPNVSAADRPQFKALRDDPDLGYIITEAQTNLVTGQETLFLVHRISAPDGTFLGQLIGTIAASRFEKIFVSLLPGHRGTIALYRRDGALLIRQPRSQGVTQVDPQIKAFFEQTIAGAEKGGLRTSSEGARPAEIVALHTVQGYPLVVTVSDSEDIVLSSWRELAGLIAAVTSAAVLLLAIGGYLLARQFRMRSQVEAARADRERAARARVVAETAERVQARARGELKTIMDHSIDGLILIDRSGTVLNFSEPAERVFGYRADEVVGRSIKMLLLAPEETSPDRNAAGGPVAEDAWIGDGRREREGRRKDGSIFPMEWAVGEIESHDGGRSFVATVRDITEQKAAQEQLRQSQKMDAIGQLTGGVAHDFNNILTVIVGTIEILAAGVADRPELAAIAKMIDDAATRGANLTQQLLAFSRKQPLEPRDVDVNFLITDTSKLLRPTLGEHVEIALRLEPDAWHAMVDPFQLSTALLNLAINARDAMPDGGKLMFETGNVVLDEAYAASNPEVTPGYYVIVAVSDTGVGIPADIRERIFEPFFTTKEIGRGTGLGLSMVYGFIKQSRGHIKVYSETGHGTTIRIYLPRSDEHGVPGRIEASTAVLPCGHETILVVEDDELVRDYVLTQLQSLGYATLSAHDAASALRLVDENAAFDLIFTDVIMPGMNGRQLADEVRRRRPDVKVLYTSGYTENAIFHHGRLDPGVTLLAKPYRKSDLARKIREAMGAT